MSKEKKRNIEEEVVEDTYLYYEIIGIIIILLSIIVLTELGKIGYNLMIFFKLFFGDWYWLIIILLLIMGCYFLVKHETINYKTMRFNGIVLVISSLLVLSHFPIVQYLELHNNNTMFGTWELYVSYLGNFKADYIMGGGIIGGVMSSILNFLLGSVGTKIICILLLLTGISFFFNNSIFESTQFLKKGLIDTKGYLFSFRKRIIEMTPLKTRNIIPKIRTSKNSPLSYNILSDVDFTMNRPLQKKVGTDYIKGLNNIFNVLDISYEFDRIDIGASVTMINYRLLSKVDLIAIKEKVNDLIDSKCLIKYNSSQNRITFEFNNKFRDLLTLKKVIQQNKNSNTIPIGQAIDDTLIDIDFKKHRHLFISGDFNTGITNTVSCILISLYLTYDQNSFRLCFYDNQYHFEEFYNVNNIYDVSNNDFDEMLGKLSLEIEKRLELFNYTGVSNVAEYNKKISNREVDFTKIEKIYFVINSFEKIINNKIENSLMYLAQLGEKCGIHLIVINRIPNVLTPILNSVLPTKLLFQVSNLQQSTEIIDYDYGVYLQNRGDFIFKNENILIRGQAAYVSKSDITKVLKKLY